MNLNDHDVSGWHLPRSVPPLLSPILLKLTRQGDFRAPCCLSTSTRLADLWFEHYRTQSCQSCHPQDLVEAASLPVGRVWWVREYLEAGRGCNVAVAHLTERWQCLPGEVPCTGTGYGRTCRLTMLIADVPFTVQTVHSKAWYYHGNSCIRGREGYGKIRVHKLLGAFSDATALPALLPWPLQHTRRETVESPS
jgi:hypothetical protein